MPYLCYKFAQIVTFIRNILPDHRSRWPIGKAQFKKMTGLAGNGLVMVDNAAYCSYQQLSLSKERMIKVVSFPSLRHSVMFAGLCLALAGCTGTLGNLGLPNVQSGPAASNPQARQSASDVAGASGITDETTRLLLSNPKKLTGYCPPVRILGDTNVYQSFDKKHQGSANHMIHQGTITQTARECTTLGAEMYIKVGVAGRVLAGPLGENKKAVLPLRIVVRQSGTEVLYTKMHKIPVTLTPPDRSAMFAKVDDGIAIPTPAERNVEILVGFDTTSGKN